ncbi:MAG: sterol desaturase family protein [Deltaproteobacteria bacterium]|nr:sterol desaturase family protein [Deltaproteobacteria bacterium]MBW2448594.1 sterol desaturase family protein [Deltaproteobacteria bacterium]
MSTAQSVTAEPSDRAAAIREAKREKMMSKVPARYSGRAHWAFINLTTLLGIGICLALLESPVWWEWLFVPGFFVFANGFEWWIHRGPMHHPTRGLRLLYERHTKQHHVFYPDDDMAYRDPRELFYVLFPPLALPMLLVVNLPIPLLLGHFVSANIAWLFFLSVLAYYFVYEWFHYVHHLRCDSWLGRRALVGWLRTQHTRHHELARMEKGNFNVSFPLWDWLLGTMLPDLGRESPDESA